MLAILMVIKEDTFDYSLFSKKENKIIESYENIQTCLLNETIEKYKNESWIINTRLTDDRFSRLNNKSIRDIALSEMKLLSYYYKSKAIESDLIIFYDLEIFDHASILLNGKLIKGSNNNAGKTVGKTSNQLKIWLNELISKYLILYKSIMNKSDCLNELYLAYKKNDYVAKMIFEDLVVMIEDNIRSFFMLLDPNYIILGAGNYKLKRQMLLDIIDASQYLKDNIKRIKLDVRTQNIMLGLLV